MCSLLKTYLMVIVFISFPGLPVNSFRNKKSDTWIHFEKASFGNCLISFILSLSSG